MIPLALVAALAGCSLNPEYRRPDAPVAAQWPQGEGYATPASTQASAEELGWREFFRDPALRQLVETALDNNRDLRVAALNIEAYRAQYRIQRSELYPAINAGVGGSRQRLPADVSRSGESMISSEYSATLGVNAWELDFFGRLRSLRDQALEQYLASEEARRSTQISLVANVATAYLTWQADRTLLDLTRDTLKAYEQSYSLTQRSFDVGIGSALELRQARTTVESARVSLAQYTRRVAQDQNALVLLLGRGLPERMAPSDDLAADVLAEIPAGLPSDLLQRRPDILQAEHALKGANANIGAARAAFFPSISLTANAGSLSTSLSGLFDGGSGTWLFQPQISLPIFNAGRLRANLDYAEVQKNIQVAQYEKAIQTAFKEVADGLSAQATYSQQLEAQRDLVKATEDYYRLAEQRYRTGIDNYLTLLDAQRQLFSVRQQLIGDRLNQLTSEVELYKALGGGWREKGRT
nr:AdeC/AdeK/OprM family multidrug efflux complex outer membrane factor [Pseudomonas sp. RIT-PI-AD]